MYFKQMKDILLHRSPYLSHQYYALCSATHSMRIDHLRIFTLPSNRQHLSSGALLEDKREDHRTALC